MNNKMLQAICSMASGCCEGTTIFQIPNTKYNQTNKVTHLKVFKFLCNSPRIANNIGATTTSNTKLLGANELGLSQVIQAIWPNNRMK